MEKFDLEQFTEDFIEGIVRPLHTALDDAKNTKENAKQHYNICVDQSRNDLEARKSALLKKAEAIKEELDVLAQRNQAALDKLSVALSTGDAEAEAAAQTEINAIAAEEYVTQKRYDAMREVKIFGRDEFYEAVLQALAGFVSIEEKYCEKSRIINRVAGTLIQLLEDVQRRARIGTDSYERKYLAKKAWKVIDEHHGPIDLRGNMAGGTENAQKRYALALATKKIDPSFDRSPAGEQLKQDIRNRLLIALSLIHI